MLGGDLEQRPRVDLGDLFHGLVPVLPAERAEVELAEGLLDQALLVVLVERLAGHLLGGEDRQVGDLGADLLDRAARLGLDVAARLLQQLLALGPGLLDGLALVRPRRPCARGR